ncbi:hypothetical protein [Mariniflexile sp. AS56]|uniref:hypothetical protein n=1 Tax=Mariniflexile sp. AS56 TaxID=3063957 RepID=UPI0026ECDA6A|nr:hypothetical protein [Mariniflexile sp. AS56]MDO7171243.1 hypothetical protein [Mariniflexile sp. AS56]
MKKQTALFLFICFSFICHSQNGHIIVELNYNTYSHASLKSFQQEFIEDIPEIPIEVNDNFPANIGFTLGYKINEINTSFFLSYNSTGGKISYSDYSGVIRITQPLNAYTFGGEYQIELFKDSGFSLGLRGFSMLSNMKLENYTQISDNVTYENIKFETINYGAGGKLIYEYPISFCIIRVSFGYDITFGGTLKFKENNDFHLENNNGDTVKTNWSGLRTGLGIEIPI